MHLVFSFTFTIIKVIFIDFMVIDLNSSSIWLFSYPLYSFSLFGNELVYSNNTRPGKSFRVVAGDTVFGDERPPTSLSSSGDAARVPPWAIAPPGSPNTSTYTHTRAPHTASPVGSNPGRARPPTQPVEAGRGVKQQQQLE